MLSIHFLLKGSTSIHHVSQTTDVDDGEKVIAQIASLSLSQFSRVRIGSWRSVLLRFKEIQTPNSTTCLVV